VNVDFQGVMMDAGENKRAVAADDTQMKKWVQMKFLEGRNE
jgi:hypothetical protein